MSIPYCPLETT